MRKIIIMITAMALFATNAFAEITLFIGGKPGGTIHTRGTLMAEVFKEKGIAHNVVFTSGEKAAYEAWKAHKGDGIFTTTTNYIMVVSADINPKTLVSYEYADPYVLCKRADAPALNESKNVNLAIWSGQTTAMMEDVDKANKIKFKYIKFGVSKDILNSFVSGESQYLFTTLKVAGQVIKNEGATCVLNSGEKTISIAGQSVPGVTEIVKLKKSKPFLTGSVNFSNNAEVRKALDVVYASKQFKDWIEKNGYSLLLSDVKTEEALFEQHLAAFKN
jgi:hypothetical protein